MTTVTISIEAAAVKAVPTPGTSTVVADLTELTFESTGGRPEGVPVRTRHARFPSTRVTVTMTPPGPAGCQTLASIVEAATAKNSSTAITTTASTTTSTARAAAPLLRG